MNRASSEKDREKEKLLYPNRVIITSKFHRHFLPVPRLTSHRYSNSFALLAYPDQSGIKPTPLQWGATDPITRGPVVCSRLPGSIKVRNAIGAHSGSYSIYRALAIGMGTLEKNHRPDYSMTEPPVSIPPQPSWSDPSKIVSFDPWGHVAPQVYKHDIDAGLDVRPSIAVTRAHIKLSEIDHPLPNYSLPVDGKYVVRSRPLLNEDGSVSELDPGVELPVSKAAIEPVWYLPGVAERFGV